MLTGEHAATMQHLQLGEGVLLADIDLDAVLAAASPRAAIAALIEAGHTLGATPEGSVFRCVPEVTDAEKGAHRTPVKGASLLSGYRVTLTGVLLEVTGANASRLLGGGDCASGMLTAPAASAAGMDSLCWVGCTAAGLLAIELYHPLSTGGLSLHTRRQGEGTMPFAFLAQNEDPEDTSLPFRMVWLGGAA